MKPLENEVPSFEFACPCIVLFDTFHKEQTIRYEFVEYVNFSGWIDDLPMATVTATEEVPINVTISKERDYGKDGSGIKE